MDGVTKLCRSQGTGPHSRENWALAVGSLLTSPLKGSGDYKRILVIVVLIILHILLIVFLLPKMMCQLKFLDPVS